MPGPVIHIGVALVALLLYFDDRHRKYVLLLLPFAVLPDLDHFAPFYAGRDILHNVFLLVLPLAVALYGLKIKNNVLYSVALMAGFLLFSHLVLDFFNGGEALFYPLRTTWYGFTNTWEVAHSAVALIPEPLRGVPGLRWFRHAAGRSPCCRSPSGAAEGRAKRGVRRYAHLCCLSRNSLRRKAASIQHRCSCKCGADLSLIFLRRLAIVARVDRMPAVKRNDAKR